MTELPRYLCHKQVRAVKIVRVELEDIGVDKPHYISVLIPEDSTYEPIRVSGEFSLKHLPDGAGYYVVYDDGYTSWSPVEAFEKGYTLITSQQGEESLDVWRRRIQTLVDENNALRHDRDKLLVMVSLLISIPPESPTTETVEIIERARTLITRRR